MVKLELLGFLLMENSILVLETGELYNQGFALGHGHVTGRELTLWLGIYKAPPKSCEHCSKYVNSVPVICQL